MLAYSAIDEIYENYEAVNPYVEKVPQAGGGLSYFENANIDSQRGLDFRSAPCSEI